MTADTRILEALLRNRFAHFARGLFAVLAPGETLVWNWHLDALCHALERVLRGEIRRLIIEVPPRSLKSVLGSVLYPAYALGRDPTAKIICASYSQDLAVKHSNDCRAVMRSERYHRLFPASAIGHGKDSETEFHTSARGYRYATSPGGTLTGRGARLLILDDIMSAGEAASDARRTAIVRWYGTTAFSRLNDKKTDAVIVITQRLHVEDLPGVLRDQGDFEVLSLPAIAPVDQLVDLGYGRRHRFAAGDLLHPAREPHGTLDDIRRTLGSYAFSAQYLQQPVPIEGAVVKWDWFRFHEGSLPRLDVRVVQSWDIGMSEGDNADWSVCTTWLVDGANYHLIDITRGRWGFPELLRQVTGKARQFRANTILVEDMVTGTALIQQLRAQATSGLPLPIARKPIGSKLDRFIAETPAIEAGHVHLPPTAPWLDDLRRELAQFPNGRHDDQVDSISQFLNWMRTKPTVRRITKMRLIGR
ncbi:MAG: phage terminase large subunit [Janthinobacterium lividum]